MPRSRPSRRSGARPMPTGGTPRCRCPGAGRPADQARRRRVVRRPDGRLPNRAGRRRDQPRSASTMPELKQAARGATGQPVQPVEDYSRDPGRPLRRRRGTSPTVEPPEYLVQLSPGLYEAEQAAGSPPGSSPGRPARRAGVPRRVRPAGGAPMRPHGRHGRGRPGRCRLPRLGRRQPLGLLRPLRRVERPLERAGSTSWSSGRRRRCGAWRRRTCADEQPGMRPAQRRGPKLAQVQSACWRRHARGPAPPSHPPPGSRRRGGRHEPGDRPPTVREGRLRRDRSTSPHWHARDRPRPAAIEPTPDGRWTADLGPAGGPVLGPFPRRSEALDAERAWLGK